MNDPISTSILLIMVLVITICIALNTVLVMVGVRYLGSILDRVEGGNSQRSEMEHRTLAVLSAFNDRDRLHRPTQDGPPKDGEVRQPLEAVKPNDLKAYPCDRDVHDPHTWEAKTWQAKGGLETVWCPGLTEAQSAEADRLASLSNSTPRHDYVPPRASH